jgi:hypothetical protein
MRNFMLEREYKRDTLETSWSGSVWYATRRATSTHTEQVVAPSLP